MTLIKIISFYDAKHYMTLIKIIPFYDAKHHMTLIKIISFYDANIIIYFMMLNIYDAN